MDLVINLCENFCSYYKPSKEAELSCRGFVVVKELIKTGRQVPFDVSKRRSSPLTEEALRKVLCPTCPFYEDDCDFILQKGEALPCGGFIILGHVIERGIIGVDDVRDIE